MSPRNAYPVARLPDTHYFISFSKGASVQTYAVRPWLLHGAWLLGLTFVLFSLASGSYLVFHDNIAAMLLVRQSEMQTAYEDRMASMRADVDRITTRQLLNQDSFEGKVQQLVARQAQLESRSAMVNSLISMIDQRDVTGTIAKTPEPTVKLDPRRSTKQGSDSSLGSDSVPLTLAPINGPANVPYLGTGSSKPRPEAVEMVPRQQGALAPSNDQRNFADLQVGSQLSRITQSLDQMENKQIKALSGLDVLAAAKINRWRMALSEAGLSLDKLQANSSNNDAVGGPYIPVKADNNASPFDHAIFRLQTNLVLVSRFQRVLQQLPLRQPLPGSLEMTSPFGYRTDPFLGRPALHPGIDFREEYGAPIRATAAGRVTTAAMTGGYGNMVEVSHGNGLATRYGHMSQILVTEGQYVQPGTILGRIGSTGRSTGPHLHYEVRVDDEAVDPSRFLRAGAHLLTSD